LIEYEGRIHASDEDASEAASKLGRKTGQLAKIIASNSWFHGYQSALSIFKTLLVSQPLYENLSTEEEKKGL